MDSCEIVYNELLSVLDEKCKEVSFNIVHEKLENSIDFMLDGESKRTECLRGMFDLMTNAEIDISRGNKDFLITYKVKININDFTLGSKFEHILFSESSENHCFLRDCDVVKRLLTQINKSRTGILRRVKPSIALSSITGSHLQKRYEILGSISDYINQNTLLMSNGSIKVDKQLEAIFGKETRCINENYFFDSLKEHFEIIN